MITDKDIKFIRKILAGEPKEYIEKEIERLKMLKGYEGREGKVVQGVDA